MSNENVVLGCRSWLPLLAFIKIEGFKSFSSVYNESQNRKWKLRRGYSKTSKVDMPTMPNYFIHDSENQCISKLDKIGIFIDMKFH